MDPLVMSYENIRPIKDVSIMAKIAPFSPLPPDLYEQEVNFAELALQFPDFAKRLKPNGQLDFSDPESVRQLTKSLLRRDFDLEIELPEDRLCPPVLYRDLRLLVEAYVASSANPTTITANTNVDSKSLQYANKNIVLNEMSSKITLVTSTLDGPLIPEKIFEQTPYLSFTMTNPPFYSSTADLLSSAASKSRPPYSSCTGAPIEMIYETPDPTISNLGGELSFIFRLLAQSMQQDVRTNVQWFTTMFGKLSSASALTEKLQEDPRQDVGELDGPGYHTDHPKLLQEAPKVWDELCFLLKQSLRSHCPYLQLPELYPLYPTTQQP
ncbi:hypothetical protein UCRPC4_g01021 [Phaeomoniella chlamydospora]|uniref:Uncharacterized protein n=1 Tax=Phaeomoniella chlamydospora TaxID=158046 RepID=A0A0G2EZN2_PHACM|nr:hypothetical protein UCRPC4_g01021 [Phaeomoniella chlamydospora]